MCPRPAYNGFLSNRDKNVSHNPANDREFLRALPGFRHHDDGRRPRSETFPTSAVYNYIYSLEWSPSWFILWLAYVSVADLSFYLWMYDHACLSALFIYSWFRWLLYRRADAWNYACLCDAEFGTDGHACSHLPPHLPILLRRPLHRIHSNLLLRWRSQQERQEIRVQRCFRLGRP